MILGAVEVEGKWYFQAKNEAGEDISIADLITRCEPSKINAELKRRKRYVIWHKQLVENEEESIRCG